MSTFAICTAVLLFAGSTLFAAYFYGQFAERARGEPSFALPLENSETVLDRRISALAGNPEGANGLALLSSNLDAFAARGLAARAAGRSLDLMYYVWNSDVTGRLLADEVIRAADRGVRVRLLVDDINTRGRDPIYIALDSHPAIEVRLFNPCRARNGALRRGIEMVLRAFSATRRMHNKAWIADGRLAVVGGRNVGDEYFDAAEHSNFHDLDLALVGPIVQQIEEIFDNYWNSPVVIPIKALAHQEDVSLEALRTRFTDLMAGEIARPYLGRVRERISVVAMLDNVFRHHWTDDVKVVSDPPEKAISQHRENWLMTVLFPLMAAARKALEISSPYFVPGKHGTAALIGLAQKGVNVTVLTNSLAATDVAAVHGGYAHCRKSLLRGGVSLFELRPDAGSQDMTLFGSSGASLHTKAFTVDDRTGFIGSFNFDPRSVALNTEMGVLFQQSDLVSEMKVLFAQETAPHMSYQLKLSPGGSLSWAGEREGKLEVLGYEPETNLWRRLLAKIVRLLPIQSQL